jgi:uncharacterized protein YbjT (DUF2867 family)
MTMYLVTGAAGNVGSYVVRELLRDGQKVRAFTRDPAGLTHLRDRAEIARGDFRQPETFASALDGISGVFLNTGPAGDTFGGLLAALKAQGSPCVVFLSTIIADEPGSEIGKLHKDKEDAIRAAGLSGTFLRPGGFMSNSLRWAGTIRAEGVVYNPTGAGKTALIAPEDIAAVASRALTTQELSGQIFELTGAELLSVPEQVEILSGVLGRPLRCVDVSMEAAVQGMIASGIPARIAAGVGQSLEAIRDGRIVSVKDTVQRVTGRPPKTFAAWAQEHASRFG